MILDCPYDNGHEYPDDWILGGADGKSPTADPRWKPTTYHYFDDRLQAIHVAQEFTCDEGAIDNFTNVAAWGSAWNPVYVAAQRPGSTKLIMLPVRYDKATDTASDVV